MAHIVVLGAGIGGMPAAYDLKAKLGREHRITVVGAADYFQLLGIERLEPEARPAPPPIETTEPGNTP